MQTTFPRLMLDHAAQRPNAPALREKAFGIWQTLSWAQLAKLVRELTCGLAHAGLRRGENLVVIGESRPRLYASMLAAQSLGAVAVPLYQDAAVSELIFPLLHADVSFVIVEDQEQIDKMLELREHCPQLRCMWFDNPRGLRNYSEPGLDSLDTLIAAGRVFDAQNSQFFTSQVQLTQPHDVATIFFTSGTTGNPKGVVHNYLSLIDRAEAGAKFDRLSNREEVLAFLPMAWIWQTFFSYAQWLFCGYVVNCPESPETAMIDLAEIGPTYYFAPPRVFESLLTGVMIRMQDACAAKRWLFDRFMAVAIRVGSAKLEGKKTSLFDSLLDALGNVLIYGPLRNMLGFSRLRVAYTAGEAIGPELFTFYRAIGINLKQLYGSTETAVFVCMQADHDVKADTVGGPMEGVELRVVESGEVLVRTPGAFLGYYKDDAATAAVLTPDKWYRTGDAGFLDADGHLKIIDRANDIGHLKGGSHNGALFAPKFIENKLKFSSYIKEAVAFGDAREMVCVFINIDFDAVGNWAEKRGLPYGGYADLSQKPEVYELVRGCVEKVNVDLAADENLAGSQIGRFLILHKELDADDGELTRTRKVRRNFIAGRYSVLVDAIYAGKHSQYIETAVKFEDGRIGKAASELRLADAMVYPALKRVA